MFLQGIIPQIECEDSYEEYGRFVIEPLEPGFGTTLGNSLRRVLLSALPGAAVTAVKVEGIQHEFTTIAHAKEDVIEFMLNVKQLRLKALSDRPGRLFLEVTGEGSVCAGDITLSADFEVANPELHLITLDSSDAHLDVVFYVELGKGYVPAGHGDGLPLGVIPVDAIYTPVRRVNLSVTKTRVGSVSNCDRLVLEVWTDGTITPSEALSQSADILVSHFSLFHDLNKAPVEGETLLAPAIPPEQYEIPLDQLGLSARTFNSLRRNSITKVGELLEKSHEDLLALRSFGQKSLDEVGERLEALGIHAPPPITESDSSQDGVDDSVEEAESEESMDHEGN